MRLLTHIVTPQEDGLPVKHLLQRHFALSSTLLKSVKWREGGITCNGHPVTVSARCRAGDRLTVDVSDPPCHNPNLHPVDFPLSILWEDEDLLILNKPAGITVHCGRLTPEEMTALLQGADRCVDATHPYAVEATIPTAINTTG